MTTLKRFLTINGSTKKIVYENDGWQPSNQYTEFFEKESFPFSKEDVIKFAQENGRVIEEETKWGWFRFFLIGDSKISLGHFNAKGESGLEAHESSDQMRGATSIKDTQNFLRGISDVYNPENFKVIIDEYIKTDAK